MSRTNRSDPLDFYPTPPECVDVLLEFLREFKSHSRSKAWRKRSSEWLDPCVGAGAIPAGLRKMGRWSGLDLNADAGSWVVGGRYVEAVQAVGGPKSEADHPCSAFAHADALVDPWPEANVGENPPFNQLEAFVRKTVDHVRRTNLLGACLVRGQWLDDADGQRALDYRPDAIVRMCWRANFSGGSGAMSTHCWLVWLPLDRPDGFVRTYYVSRPPVPRWRRDLHVAMRGGLRSVQCALEIG